MRTGANGYPSLLHGTQFIAVTYNNARFYFDPQSAPVNHLGPAFRDRHSCLLSRHLLDNIRRFKNSSALGTGVALVYVIETSTLPGEHTIDKPAWFIFQYYIPLNQLKSTSLQDAQPTFLAACFDVIAWRSSNNVYNYLTTLHFRKVQSLEIAVFEFPTYGVSVKKTPRP